MRQLTGGVAHVAARIEEDLVDRGPSLHKPHIKGLADLSASVLVCKSANTSEWQSVLPRSKCSDLAKEHYTSRFLANKLIKPTKVMESFVPEILKSAGSDGKVAVLALDQSKISNSFECLMVSLRVGERAIPIAWKVIKTKGEIGFAVQKKLLDSVNNMVPKEVSILLTADRFYGTSALVKWCQENNWQYRIRLKGNLVFAHQGGELSSGDAVRMKMQSLKDAVFNGTQVKTNIGILHQSGYPEPWIIAMDANPSKYKVLDYGIGWGIESMFSDFKSRGFCITKTNLKHEDRIERMILVLTIALYWAVSTGMKPRNVKVTFSKKNSTDL